MSETPRTEARNPRAAGLAEATTAEILALMNDEDATVAVAVRGALPDIGRAVDAIVSALAAGGHVRYVGAGTSGRLGVLDASEAPPTFGVAPDLFHGIIAGGDGALRSAIEGAEDSADAGGADLAAVLAPHDVVVGLSASGRAPYVLGALDAARSRGLETVGVTCVAGSALARAAAIPIVVDVGPEIIAGSSRLKAGTATKLVLNMLSTAAMIRSGRTKGDLMIDVRATNEKLRARAIGIVRDELGVDEADARARLEACEWSVRRAIAPR
ncbi:MAG TPA: N-acetylmuramic acid 6-phosphate etherase [Candidatus Saccharimonadales bacterium]|nr:N-acetylmuramic acid 6-phosphate etherase [Candidatus Saccharimonadales bacterium]